MKKVILPVFTVIRVDVINVFPLYVATVVYRCVQSAKDDQILYANVTVDAQSVVYVSIEENTVGLVIDAMNGCVTIVEVAIVIKVPVDSRHDKNHIGIDIDGLDLFDVFIFSLGNVECAEGCTLVCER